MKYSFIGLMLFIAFCFLMNSQANHHDVMLYSGSDKLIYRVLLVVFITTPLLLVNIDNWLTTKRHWVFKVLLSLLATPVIAIIFFIISTQTIKPLVNLYICSNLLTDIKETKNLKVINKSVTQNHGKHHSAFLQLENGKIISYLINETEYEDLEIGNSIEVEFFTNSNGSIYK